MTSLKKTDEEIVLWEKAERHYPHHWRNSGYDMVVKEARGSTLWDMSGNEYVDYLMGSGPIILGHAHPAVVHAVTEQLNRGTTYMALNEPALLLAEEVARAVPCAETKVRFCSTGTDADFYAMRLCRAFTKKDKILKFAGAMHGMSDYAITSGAGIPKAISELMLVAPFNDINATEALLKKHRHELAGVIVEPLHRTIPPRENFLKDLRLLTEQYEVPLIFDEVITGFRLGYGGAQEYYGVIPDLCTQGKVICGGLPLGAICGRDDIMAHLYPDKGSDAINASGTLSANPLCAAAGLATLQELRKPGTYEKLFADGKRLWRCLDSLLKQAEIPVHIQGEPPVFQIYFMQGEFYESSGASHANMAMYNRFATLLRERGVIKALQKFFISTSLTEENLRHTESAFAGAVDQLHDEHSSGALLASNQGR